MKILQEKKDIFYNIQIILFFILMYQLIKKSQSSKDIILIGSLMLVTIIKNYKEKIYLKLDKKIFFLTITYLVYIILNYIILSSHYKNIVAYKMLESLIKSLVLFFLMTQIKFKRNTKNIIFPMVLLGTLNPIIKGLIIIKETGIFKERIGLWENPNYYSMVLGIFIIISLFSLFKYKSYFIKILSLFIFGASFFIIICLTQSKTTFLSIIIILFIFSCDYLKEKYIKLKIVTALIFIFLMFYLWQKNARILTTFRLEHILNDGRIILWKIGLETFIIEKKYIFGVGIGYFTNHLIKFRSSELGALHNDFIEILVPQGIVGVVLYYSFLLSLLFKLYKNISENEFSKIGTYCIFYLILIGMSDVTNISLRIPQLILIICGLGINISLNNESVNLE